MDPPPPPGYTVPAARAINFHCGISMQCLLLMPSTAGMHYNSLPKLCEYGMKNCVLLPAVGKQNATFSSNWEGCYSAALYLLISLKQVCCSDRGLEPIQAIHVLDCNMSCRSRAQVGVVKTCPSARYLDWAASERGGLFCRPWLSRRFTTTWVSGLCIAFGHRSRVGRVTSCSRLGKKLKNLKILKLFMSNSNWCILCPNGMSVFLQRQVLFPNFVTTQIL